jgi:hypothetical protein
VTVHHRRVDIIHVLALLTAVACGADGAVDPDPVWPPPLPAGAFVLTEPGELYLTTGRQFSVGAAVVDPQQQTKLPFHVLSWTSSDESVATVSEFGDVVAVAPGRATIRVAVGDVGTEIPVVVSPPANRLRGSYFGLGFVSPDVSYRSVCTDRNSGYGLSYARYRFLTVDSVETTWHWNAPPLQGMLRSVYRTERGRYTMSGQEVIISYADGQDVATLDAAEDTLRLVSSYRCSDFGALPPLAAAQKLPRYRGLSVDPTESQGRVGTTFGLSVHLLHFEGDDGNPYVLQHFDAPGQYVQSSDPRVAWATGIAIGDAVVTARSPGVAQISVTREGFRAAATVRVE